MSEARGSLAQAPKKSENDSRREEGRGETTEPVKVQSTTHRKESTNAHTSVATPDTRESEVAASVLLLQETILWTRSLIERAREGSSSSTSIIELELQKEEAARCVKDTNVTAPNKGERAEQQQQRRQECGVIKIEVVNWRRDSISGGVMSGGAAGVAKAD